MLAELEIENLAVIAHARIPFSPRLNVFTGETGAGKSILLHGIHAVLGQRVTRDIVRTGCKKAVVTALFTHLDPLVCARLDALSISHVDDELLRKRRTGQRTYHNGFRSPGDRRCSYQHPWTA